MVAELPLLDLYFGGPGLRCAEEAVHLPDCVEIHVNDDPRSGREKGLVCLVDHDGIVGCHPEDARGARAVG
jgi:hypothetical protein